MSYDAYDANDGLLDYRLLSYDMDVCFCFYMVDTSVTWKNKCSKPKST